MDVYLPCPQAIEGTSVVCHRLCTEECAAVMEGKPKPRLSEAQRRRQPCRITKFRHNPCRVDESHNFISANKVIPCHSTALGSDISSFPQPSQVLATGGRLKHRIGTTKKAVGWTNPKRWKLLMTLKIWWVTQRPLPWGLHEENGPY